MGKGEFVPAPSALCKRSPCDRIASRLGLFFALGGGIEALLNPAGYAHACETSTTAKISPPITSR
jgi:hypothetical protein